VVRVGIELMILGGIQAGMSVKGGMDASEAAKKAHGINQTNYGNTSRGIAASGASQQRQATSEKKTLSALGGNAKGAEISAENISYETALRASGAESEFLNNKVQINQAEKQAQIDAVSGVISGATLMTTGMMGGPKIAGKTSYDPRWGGLGGLMGWFTR